MPMVEKIGTRSPSRATILSRTPSTGDSTSKTAFSVSTSQRTSPLRIDSPSRFSQRTTSPSVMSWPAWGMMILVAISCT